MEEIERSQGVTIVEMETRASIGEEVEEAPPPPAESEESEVQRGLEAVADALEVADAPREEPWAVEAEEEEAAPAEEEEYETEEHGLVPVPPSDSPAAAWQTAPAPAAEEEGVAAGEEVAETAPEAEAEDAQADGFAEEDPYATGGLLKRIQQSAPPETAEPQEEGERPFTTFDWRGRPLS
jgi:hypothetical protein